MDKMKIEIWSDIACPYCYIGKRKLEKALSLFPHADNITLEWHSYELDPDLPKGASSKSFYQYLAENHGTTESAAKDEFAAVMTLAKEVGLNYNPEKIIVTNTSDALRLVKLANKYGLATEAEEVLFSAYFVEGLDISNKDILVQLGTRVGMLQGDIIRMLNSFEYSEEIRTDIAYAENELQLKFIPFYLLNNKQIIQGSISVDDYLKAIKDAYEYWLANGTFNGEDRDDAILGQSCSIDGVCG